MARGSGAGTGVIVALVVSVVCNVGLLTITFMMYSGKAEALENEAKAQAEMTQFVKSSDRTNEFERQMDAAKNNQQSLYKFLQGQRGDVAQFVAGNPNADVTEMRSSLGLAEGDVVRNELGDLRRQLASAKVDNDSLQRQLADVQSGSVELEERVTKIEKLAQEKIAQVEGEFGGYKTAAVRYQQEIEQAIQSIEESRVKLDRDYRNRMAGLQSRLDRSNQDNSVFRAQIEELRKKTEAYRIKPASPAELADGRIINVPGTNGQVFIDLGRNQRIVPGMTFEVYQDVSAIRPDPRTGDYVRGKASIEIIKVGTDTSTARITRELTGRPVVKDDVIANAVFNPDYRFKFLVHGLFDVNGDGRPNSEETDYVRRRIIEWGGEVVEGDDLTGDLDFLVLGAQPPMPAPLPPDAGDDQFRRFLKQRESREQYDRLFEQSTKAQIPVLNWNRFEMLTGMNAN
jgi:hypothetical protein